MRASMLLDNSVDNVLILGAGLAGLTAARELNRGNRLVTVIEADEKIGGLARTIEYKGFRFDLGGHRFVTNNPDLDSYVRNLLGEDCLCVPRTSKILLRNRYFDYRARAVVEQPMASAFLLSRESGFSLRVDQGFGEEDGGTYFSFGEAF